MQKIFVKYCTLIGLGVLLLLLFSISMSSAQVSRTFVSGETRFTGNEALSADDIVWPNSWDKYSFINNDRIEMLETAGVIVCQKLNWTDPSGVPWNRQVGMAVADKYTNLSDVVVPVSGEFKRTFRTPYPSKILDGVDRTRILESSDPVDPSIPSDEEIYNKMKVWPAYNGGIQIERYVYGFVNTDYTDIVILEWVFTNTSSSTKEGVVFGLNAQTNAHTYYGADIWGSYYGANYQKYADPVSPDPAADSLRMWYSWTADQKNTAEDDQYYPDESWGNIEEPQYYSYSILHADKSAADPTDDPAQPSKVQQAQRDAWPNLSEATHDGIYDFFDPTNPVDDVTGYSKRVNGAGVDDSQGKYEVLIDNFNEYDFDPLTEQEKSCVFSFGPYTLQPGEDVRIVSAYTGGTISQKLAIDMGRAYDGGYPSRATIGIIPMAYDVFDLQGNKIISQGDIVTKAQKNEIIRAIGKELVFKNAGKALQLWKAATFNANGHPTSFNIPMPPAAPSLTGTSENDQVRLEWNSVPGADKYRVYREYKRKISSAEPTDTLYYYDPYSANKREYIETTATEFIDTEVVRGEQYYYYITAVNADGLESSPFLNRTGTSTNKPDEQLAPTRGFSTTWQDSVVVVPNPYHVSAAEKYSGKRIVWLNLPAYCNIHIYTVNGDKVQTLKHTTGTGDDNWIRQDTFSTMEIVSGVYVYVVEELDSPDGSPTGEKVMGKFVVIK